MFLEVCWLPGSAQCAEPGLVLALKECFEQFVSDDTRVLWHWRYSSSPLTPTGASPRAPPAHRLVASTAVMSAPSRQFVKSAPHDVRLGPNAASNVAAVQKVVFGGIPSRGGPTPPPIRNVADTAWSWSPAAFVQLGQHPTGTDANCWPTCWKVDRGGGRALSCGGFGLASLARAPDLRARFGPPGL